MVNQKDADILRGLAARVAEIAALPAQDETRRLWRKLNAVDAERPMVMIDQVCWHELGDELELHCGDAECRGYEAELRKTLYQWDHWAVDRVVEPFIRVSMAISGTGFGVGVEQEIAVGDPRGGVVGHMFFNQFQTDADLAKVRMPEVVHDAAETQRRLAVARELFDGVLDVRLDGHLTNLTLWDPISMWMGVENALYALADRPAFMHRLVRRMTDGYMSELDQLEEQGLLRRDQSIIHCSGAFADELPAPGYDPARPRTKDLWAAGLAQMFSTVSPQMFKEFEVDYVAPMCERFGLVYYGCCDPLDRKMAEVRMIPNVRKVSMSPWVDEERGAGEIGRDFVYSRKPSPALLARDRFDPELVRADLMKTREICEKHGCVLEYILKDISTVRYEPARLEQWAAIAMEVAGAGV